MRRLPLVLSALALLLAIFVWFREPQAAPAVLADRSHEPTAHEDHEEIEIAIYMGRIQRYHQKWWAAGQAGNAELAGFYLHEMEEAMEEIATARVMDEGVDVSAHMRTYGLAAVEALEKKLKEEGVAAMHADAGLLAKTCTTCHVECGHPYLRIVPPTAVHFPDQDFAPTAK